jgi:mannitol/fructose-specific phosphotransferase system IIA component (Ntr-type)
LSPSTRTPEGQPNECPICGNAVVIEPSSPAGEAPCPNCGCLLWFLDSPGNPHLYGFHQFSISELSVRTKREALAAILDRLVAIRAFPGDCKPDVLAALLKREELGSTAIGGGVAVPHAKSADVDGTIGALATFPAGVDFGAADGQPVRRVFILLSPLDQPGEHLRLLESISRSLRDSAS